MPDERVPQPPHRLSATEAADLIRAGRLASEELVESCLDRVAERDATVRAWAAIDRDAALAEARRRDAESPRGPLHGVPVGIKDIIDTADLPTAHGSPIYEGRRPERDAACVRRLRDAGAVVLGKTVTTEFALYRPGETRNPHDPARTPGGSSSGSAAGVADYQVPLALGTQTAGSIVRPGCFCGIFALKPTYGAVDRDGVKIISPSLDTVGPFARSAEDLALALGVLAGAPAGDLAGETTNAPRIGFARTPQWDHLDAEVQSRIEAAVERLGSRAPVREVPTPGDFADLVPAQETIMHYEVARSLEVEWHSHREQLSEQLRGILARGTAVPAATYRDALRLAEEHRKRLPDLFRDSDVLLAPAVLGEPPAGLDATGDPLLCRTWTLLGTPAVAVPGLRGPAGLPLGIQVIAPPGRDASALAAARWIAASW